MFKTKIITLALNQSMAADFTSGILELGGSEIGCIEVSWASYATAGTDATFKIQGSGTGITYGDVLLVSPSTYSVTVTGATGSQVFDIQKTGLSYMKLVFTHNQANAGTISVAAVPKTLMDNGVAGG